MVCMTAIMRPNYDKFHRCPAWSGPAMLGRQPGAPECESGTLPDSVYYRRHWALRTNRCPTCGTIVLPYAVRYLDLATQVSSTIHRLRVRRHWAKARKARKANP